MSSDRFQQAGGSSYQRDRRAALRTASVATQSGTTPPRAGFTLLEMIAVVLLTALVFTAAVDFYLDLSRSSARAAGLTRSARRATSALDRVARDLEGAMLIVKPDEVDPLEHPWLFLAESEQSENGADRLKFITRRTPLQTRGNDGVDLGFVVWMTQPDADGSLTLLRWTSSSFPETLDRSFPPAEDAVVVARGLASFGVRLLDGEGAWQKAWDSSEVAQSSELPLAAEIELSFAPPPEVTPASEPLTLAAAGPEQWMRRVALPVRPLDLEALTKGDEEGTDGDEAEDKDGDGKPDDESDENAANDDDEACITVSDCLARNPQAAALAAGAGLSGVLQSIGSQCYADVKGNLPPGITLTGCE